MIFLETKRLILRKFREEDFQEFWEYANDPEMSRMMGRQDMSDEEQARANFAYLKDKEERGYCLVLKENGKLIGNLTVGKVPDDIACLKRLSGKRGCSLSFSISRAYQRRGLMFEAVCAVIDRLFWTENMDYVNCGYLTFNVASRCLQEKLGFSYLMTQTFQADGETISAIENVLFREDYRMEYCCGAVVFTRENGRIEYVIEQQCNTFHGFQKGHMESGETEKETALREVFEEVGLRPKLIDGFRETETYIHHEKKATAKTVSYFLGEYANQTICAQPGELMRAELLPYEEAMAVLEFEESKKTLTKAHNFLQQKA